LVTGSSPPTLISSQADVQPLQERRPGDYANKEGDEPAQQIPISKTTIGIPTLAARCGAILPPLAGVGVKDERYFFIPSHLYPSARGVRFEGHFEIMGRGHSQ
jgi:hypothetical protein